MYQDMYAHDLTGTHVEMRSLRELVERKLPRLAAHMAALGADMSILATEWFLCLFCTTLPALTAVRVWDALLNEVREWDLVAGTVPLRSLPRALAGA